MSKKFWLKMGIGAAIILPSAYMLGVRTDVEAAAHEKNGEEAKVTKKSNGLPGPYVAMDFSNLLGIQGFSDEALKIHFKLYEGYVKNANRLLSILNQYAREGQDRTPQYAEIKRRLGWEMDGMRLHEYYFSSMGGTGKPNPNSALMEEIERQFGSYDNWKKEFQATGAMRGIGWAILYQDPKDGRLINMWINEHDHGHLANGSVILPMDVFEHAYMLDYGLDRQGYIDAFFENLNWDLIERRYEEAQAARKTYQEQFAKKAVPN